MSILEFLSQPLFQRLGLTLVHFLWQGLAVAVLISGFIKVFRLKHGNARYGAYLLAFIVMIICPVVTFTANRTPGGVGGRREQSRLLPDLHRYITQYVITRIVMITVKSFLFSRNQTPPIEACVPTSFQSRYMRPG